MDIRLKVHEFLQERFADFIIGDDNFRDQQSIFIKPEAIYDVCQALFESPDLDIKYLADITAVDWLGNPDEAQGRFEVIYNLYSLTHQYRFFIKVHLPGDNPEIQSLTPIWNSANWLEREVFDLMGIQFTGHPDLTKILTPDELEGHPLRRDFPLTYEVPQFTWNKDNPPEVIK
jgi:NADH-quinone oxidoreductase subunit C